MARKIGKKRCMGEDFEPEEYLKAGEEKKVMQEKEQKNVFTCIFTWRMLCSSHSLGGGGAYISPPAVLP